MPVATVETAFVLLDRASGPVRKIRREVSKLEVAARSAGDALDDMATPRAIRQIEQAADETRGLGRAVRDVRPEVVSGDRALAALEGRLRSTGREARRTSAYFSMLHDRTTLFAGASVAALPAVEALGGAAVALGGSLMGAGLGAGAVGLAGGGALTAGVGALASVAVPAAKRLEEATKAQDALTSAVADFGRQSRQAIAAKRDLDRALAAAPPGARGFMAQRSAVGRDWNRATRAGQTDLLGLGTGAMSRLRRRAVGPLAGDVNRVAGAARTQGLEFVDFATGPRSLHTINVLAESFVSNLDEARGVGENLARTIGNLAEASVPFFEDGMQWLDQWTHGWATSTSDIAATRREIGGYVDDLRAWGKLTGSAFELAHSVLMGGRPAGRSAVEDLTHTLDRWDSWVDRNPAKIDAFFRNAVEDTERLADGVVSIVDGLHDLAQDLRPLIPLMQQLASTAGSIASLGPGAVGAVFAGVVGLRRGARGAGGGTGGMGAASTVAGAAAGAAAGPGRLRGAAGGAARGAGGALAINALLQSSAPGLTFNERVRNAGASIPFLGIDPAVTADEHARRGISRSSGVLGAVEEAQTLAQFEAVQRRLVARRNRVGAQRSYQGGGFLGTGLNRATASAGGLAGMQAVERTTGDDRIRGQFREDIAEYKALDQAISGVRDAIVDLRHEREVDANQRSRTHAGEIITDLGKAYDIKAKDKGPAAAFSETLDASIEKMREMRPVGARVLVENTLSWAREQARVNPALSGEVDKLTQRIERSFSRTGQRVRVINGRIVTNSTAQWKSIADSIGSEAERARQAASTSFTALQRQAIGALELMGFSPQAARETMRSAASIERQSGGRVKGAAALDAARGAAASGARYSGLAGAQKGSGDGVGLDTPRAGQLIAAGNATRATPSLMGAKAALAGYADVASGMGLQVSSGLRPGAITNAGNRSYHASGDALDVAGPAASMMRFAQYAADTWGSHLEELIYSPMGFAIKNGRRVPPYAVADHYDHVHIADTAPTRAGGAAAGALFSPDTLGPGLQQINLTAPRSGLDGVPGALADRASAVYSAGLEQKINEVLGTGGMVPGLDGGSVPMSGTLGKAQIAALAAQVGFPDPNLVAAIALAESGGRIGVINSIGATGLMQILQSAHPQYDPGRLASDPLYNLRAAFAISSGGTNWQPWEAYTRGMHRRFMGDGIGHGSSPRVGARASAPSVLAPFSPRIAVHAGTDKATLRREISSQVNQHIDEFVEMIWEEIEGGPELEGAM